MSKKLEGVHVGLLMQVTGKMSKRERDGTWRNEAAGSVLKESGKQTLETYIANRQATVAELVALRPIIEVCDRDTG